ncbi:MAG: cadmium resistance transporter [Elainella sp. C42_A2020_010]|nr:cadmium resistance transporter [Elainella sp. C42_A2020_010]
MNELSAALIKGITSFVATNLDDIVILTIFFSQINANFRVRHILVGQYLGFLVIILASLPGFLGGLVLPEAWIGLLGLVPIGIGLYQLFNSNDDDTIQTVTCELSTKPRQTLFASLLVPQTYHVAAVTIANGGDNIGIYVPLFASTSLTGLLIILSVFLVMVALWCAVAYYFSRHPAIMPILTRYGNVIVPYVLVGLGLFILIENGSYSLLPGL